jgi:TonB-linked SusC/RagA family outer membrane protein
MKNRIIKKRKLNSFSIVIIVLLIINSGQIFGQNISIKGHVYDKAQKEPLIGATVQQKGTQNAVITDRDGNFVINIPYNTALEIRYVGYATQIVSTSNKKSLLIGMEEDALTLGEVVSIGYGTAKKQDLTGSIASFHLENSPRATLPNMNIMDALKGQLPGFDVGTPTNAGGNPRVNIRGQNSIKASNTPLLVVDGVVFIGSINEINPSDIASVDILKDASSAAVYGSRAANGVILITTKRGKTEKPTVRLQTTLGVQTATSRPDMLSPEGYLQLKRDLRTMNGASDADLELKNLLWPYEYQAYEDGNIINWYDEAVRSALSQDYQISISGGNEKLNYYTSGQYLNQDGVLYNDKFKKLSVTSKIESKITDWLKIGLNLGVISKNADGVEADLRNAINNAPYGYKYIRFAGHETEMERYPQGQTSTINPLWQTQQYDKDRNQNYRSLLYANVTLPWIKGLTYTFNYSINRWEGQAARFQNEHYFINTMKENEVNNQTKYLKDANGYKNLSSRTDWFLNHIINYNQMFGKHSIDVTLLSERQNQNTTTSKLSAKDFSAAGSTALGVDALELGNPANRGVETGKTILTQLAYMGRVNYVYNQRYHLSGSIRYDGYSGFANGHKYGSFFSLAGAWTLSQENFIKNNMTFIDMLKLRLSYGENGNPSVGSYSTFSSMNTGNYLFGNTTATTSSARQLANKNLSWEKTGAWNLGIDFSIFKQLISGNIEYYNSKTTNLLLNRSIPIMNGFQNVSDNIGQIDNWGIEYSLNTKNIGTKDFTWSTGINFWLNRNKVVSLYGLDGNNDGVEDDDIANGLFIGKSLGAIYTYVFDGIIQENDAEYISKYGGKPGDIKFKDLNNDGVINADHDRKIVGYTKPNFTMSMSNTFTYKNFEFYFMLNWIAGGGKNNYYMSNNIYANLVGTFGGGSYATWLNKEYWMPEHPSNEVPRPNYSNPYGYQFPKRHDFLRLQDISLSYRVEDKFLKKTPLKNLRLYMAAKNMMTLSSWEGQDPETSTQYAHGNPAMRNLTFGIDVSF